MSPARPASGRSGRPPRTSREQVLTAARTVIERDGWERLTFRRLAAEVGVSPMALYHHVQDREDLLVQLINDHVEQVARPELPREPRDRVVVAATAMHDALSTWPWIAEVLTTDGFLSRLGESALWMVETILAAAVDEGCTPEQAIRVFRNVWYFTVGEILVRANTRARRPDGQDPAGRDPLFAGPDPSLGRHDPDRLPHLSSMARSWAEVAQEDTYVESLRAVVDGLLASHEPR